MAESRSRIVQLPTQGWCVRSGCLSAHYFVRRGARSVAVCGMVTRIDRYFPQWSRPRQARKRPCRVCARILERAARKGMP